jgi:sec-independent protein translocase protein TatA
VRNSFYFMLTSVLLFFDVSGGEIVVVLMFVLIFFGSKKIPEMARGLGKGMREIKDATDSIKREIQQESNKIRDELVKTSEDAVKEIKEPEAPKSLDQPDTDLPGNS